MVRPFIEFVQSQQLDWTDGSALTGRPGLLVKTLSRSPDDGSATLLVRYPPGWHQTDPGFLDVDEEFFVLQGEICIGDVHYGPHDYAWLPAGFVRVRTETKPGAVMLVFTSGQPRLTSAATSPASYDPTLLTLHVDPKRLAWDRTNMDPNIAHLNAYRKNLRLDPRGTCRTYLLAGLPQGYPASGCEPLERHPHVEEMFMVAGDMPCSLGIMRAGAYFWRPPSIWHGADCTLNGFLLFMRTPGSNRTISEWSVEPHPVTFTPPHRPVLPPDLAAIAGRPQPDPIVY